MIFWKKIGIGVMIVFALIGIVFSGVFIAMQFGWLNVRGTIQERNNSFFNNAPVNNSSTSTNQSIGPAWAQSSEWYVMKSVFIRDQDIIRKAAADAGISPRLLLGGIIGEQFRFFTNARDSFKAYFEPLKILASLSKFSFGIAGLKPDTVKRIDEQLQNQKSVFYLGPEMKNIVTYPEGSDHDAIRFERITDTKNTYYSYLYIGLFMRQVIAQWKASGYDISNRPEVLSTLYNLGFNRSIPKPDPSAGGAPITIDGIEYNFGQLGYEFYYSGELAQEFPY